jgi:hypothetical protein
MTNKSFMIFQTAARKYVGIYKKSQSGYFFWFYPQISIKILKKFWTKNFHNVLNFFEFSSNSKMKIRTQSFPKIDKK